MSSLDSLLAPETPAPAPAGAEALIRRAQSVASEVLAPNAERTDRAAIVPRRNVEALAEAGLLGLSGPVDCGGQAAPGWASRRIAEILAGACGVTHFVQAQHHGPVGMIAASDNVALRERYLRDLCEGRMLAGVAFSHLRRPGKPAVAVEPVPGGYRVSGEAPWVTSWGIAGVFVVAGMLPDDRILYFAREGAAGPGFDPSPPLELAVMGASSTVRIAMCDLFVPDDAVVRVAEGAGWRERDRINTAHANPAAFGITASCIRRMEELAGKSGSEALAETVAVFSDELDRCRGEAYGMADSGAGTEEIPRLLAAKAWSLDLVARAAHAYIAAVGGRAMACDHPAQRLMREAAFYTIQAQTSAVREATLGRLSAASRETAPFPAPL